MLGRRRDGMPAPEYPDQCDDGRDNQQERADPDKPNSNGHSRAGGGDVDVNRAVTERRAELHAGSAMAKVKDDPQPRSQASDSSYQYTFHSEPLCAGF